MHGMVSLCLNRGKSIAGLSVVGTGAGAADFGRLVNLKLEPFDVLFSYDMVVSVERFVFISLLRGRCCKKIRRQTARA